MQSQSEPVGVTEPPLPAIGVMDELSSALANSRSLLSNALDLLSLEAQRASHALVWMIVGAVAAAICIVTAWIGLMAACAFAAISLGMLPAAAVILVAGINLVAGAGLLYVCKGIGRNLLFAGTRRQIAGTSPMQAASP